MSLELSGTTGVKGVAGSVSAPSIVGDDTNTGISFPSADTIKFSTGGVERMQITNSGVSGTGIGAGKLLQVVHYATTTQFSTSSGSFVDVTNFNADIVPQTNSKVLVQVTLHSKLNSAASGGEGYGIKILRGSTGLLTSGGMYDIYDYAPTGTAHSRNRSTWTLLDSSPGGDGSTTINYKIQVGSHNAETIEITGESMQSSMTLFEIGA